MPAPAVDPLAPGQMAQPKMSPATSMPVSKVKGNAPKVANKKKPISSLGELKARIATKLGRQKRRDENPTGGEEMM